jgi:glycosyltransferase involved in cell wall biosynthesis
MGKAVVSTSVGCEGLAATDGANILIRDDPKRFAEAIRAVLADERLRQRLGEAGRATAQRLYGWDVVGQRMIDAYMGVMNAPIAGLVRKAEPIAREARYGYS